MQATLVQAGAAIDYTPGSAKSAGDVVVQGNLVGVATQAIAASALGSLAVQGIFDIASKNEAFDTVGAAVYWDDDGDPYGGTAGSGAATATASDGVFVGYVAATATATAGKVRVLMVPRGAPMAATVVTLTDSTGLSGSHDDTLAATTVPADLTDNGGGAAADGTIGAITTGGNVGADIPDAIKELSTKLNAALAVVRVMAQNASDQAQKTIEIVAALKGADIMA